MFRGFWTLLITLGLAAALAGGFLLVCGVPLISQKLCRLGGAFLIAAGKTFAQFFCAASVHVQTHTRHRSCAQLFISVTSQQQMSIFGTVAMATAGLNAARRAGATFLWCYSQPLRLLSPRACLFLLMLLLFVLWMEAVEVKHYILQERGEACPRAEVTALYGLSFMVAAAGVPLQLVSGLIFLLVGRVFGAGK